MAEKMSSENKFTLSFGGDEFDDSKFKIVNSSFAVTYDGYRELNDGDIHYEFYEFTSEGNSIHFVTGGSVGTAIFVALSEPPGQGAIDGQTARVAIRNDKTGEILGVGRAVLWKGQKKPA